MRQILITIFVLLGSVAFVFSFRTAGAYSASFTATTTGVPATPAVGGNGGFDNLFLPFQNFFHSISSVGDAPARVGLPTAVPPVVNASARGALERFDEWLYGIIGFHISNLFAAILRILSWLLGFVKDIVDWLIGLFRFR